MVGKDGSHINLREKCLHISGKTMEDRTCLGTIRPELDLAAEPLKSFAIFIEQEADMCLEKLGKQPAQVR